MLVQQLRSPSASCRKNAQFPLVGITTNRSPRRPRRGHRKKAHLPLVGIKTNIICPLQSFLFRRKNAHFPLVGIKTPWGAYLCKVPTRVRLLNSHSLGLRQTNPLGGDAEGTGRSLISHSLGLSVGAGLSPAPPQFFLDVYFARSDRRRC